MRIISFSKKWDKLSFETFTTFRYTRFDKDWFEGEVVQVFYKNRSPQREKLGIAEIIDKRQRELDEWFSKTIDVPLVTNEEAQTDGFVNREDMVHFMEKQYGLVYISLFNKLTLRWVRVPTGLQGK
jgi:hypothetical protein